MQRFPSSDTYTFLAVVSPRIVSVAPLFFTCSITMLFPSYMAPHSHRSKLSATTIPSMIVPFKKDLIVE